MSKLEEALKKARMEREQSQLESVSQPIENIENEDDNVNKKSTKSTTASKKKKSRVASKKKKSRVAGKKKKSDSDKEKKVDSEGKGLVRTLDVSELQTVGHLASSKQIALMEQGDLMTKDELSELKIIFSEMSDNSIANDYRDIRTKLLQRYQGKNFLAMVTTCVSSVSSSYASVNLATAFSFDRSKTSMLVDCNINRPRLGFLLKTEADKGLTDYLEDIEIDISQVIQPTGISRVRLIPAGSKRETTTEYFVSLRMRRLVDDLVERYNDRFVFIDAPPINESADTKILVDMVDLVILVVPYGLASKGIILSACNIIGKDKLFGVIFSDIPTLPAKSLIKEIPQIMITSIKNRFGSVFNWLFLREEK